MMVDHSTAVNGVTDAAKNSFITKEDFSVSAGTFMALSCPISQLNSLFHHLLEDVFLFLHFMYWNFFQRRA